MTADAPERVTGGHCRKGWSTARIAYFRAMMALVLAIAVASFIRDRGQLPHNISSWLFLIPFAVTLWRVRAGFLAAIFLLTVSPSLHEQLNVLAGIKLHAWAYPAVDCCLGFLAAWTLRGGLAAADEVLGKFPAGPLLLFHCWMVFSAAIAVGRNIWQSASELSVRGLAYNVWLTRGISWHDDYYPLQDPFFYGVAVAMLLGTWTLLRGGGERLLNELVGAALAGAAANVAFALWQKATGLGWVNGQWSINANALWPDLHSFGAFMAMTLFLGCGLLVARGTRPLVWLSIFVTAIGLFMSGSRSTFMLVLLTFLVWAISASLRLPKSRRAIPLIAAVTVGLAIHVALAHGYRGFSYDLLGQQFRALNAQSMNMALSRRPEIWTAALRMYSEFPLFGLGQGAFYRLSAERKFSESEFLFGMNGEGVHNEFLRMLVELGPIGFGLALFIAVPYLRLGRANLKLVSFYALVGIAIGSVYTNALLVRELLLLLGVFAGSYFWEAESAAAKSWSPLGPGRKRVLSVIISFVVIAALIEVAFSFGRFPFTYGQRCQRPLPLAADGWTQGAARIPIPPASAVAKVSVDADRPDLARRDLSLKVSVTSGARATLKSQQIDFAQLSERSVGIELKLPQSPDGYRYLELKPSNCFVPLNLGITYDPRRLGVRVQVLRFLTAAGDEVK